MIKESCSGKKKSWKRCEKRCEIIKKVWNTKKKLCLKLIENDISMIKNGFLNFCIFQWKLHILRLCVKICQYKSILYFSIFHYRIAIFVFDKNRRIKIVHHFRFLFIKIKISYYITVKLVLLIEIEKSCFIV